MSDLISRQAAIDAVSESLKRVFPEHRQIAEKCLNALPSAQLEQGWIPCSERPPEEGEGVIVQYGDGSLGIIERVRLKIWNLINSPYAKVVAWMPLPEPYRIEGWKNE